MEAISAIAANIFTSEAIVKYSFLSSIPHSVTTAQAMTSLHSHHTYTLWLEKCSIARDIDCTAKKGFGFSRAREDEFLSQSVLQPDIVLLLSRHSAVPIIHAAVEFNMEFQKWASSFLP